MTPSALYSQDEAEFNTLGIATVQLVYIFKTFSLYNKVELHTGYVEVELEHVIN